MTSFVIPGKAVGKGRPRATSRGGFARMYTPKATVDYEERVRAAYTDAGGKMLKGPIGLNIYVHQQVPKSWSKAMKEAMHGEWCERKPDLDNVEKIIADALNGVAYEDDSSICHVYKRRHWVSQESSVQVHVFQLDAIASTVNHIEVAK